jgi:hypothetical protein
MSKQATSITDSTFNRSLRKKEVDALVLPLRDRLAELEAENKALKRQTAACAE